MRRSVVLLIVGLAAASARPIGAQETLYDLLVSSRASNSVIRFDGATGEYVDDFIEPMSGGLRSTQEVLLSPDGDLIVSGLENTQILRYDYRTGAPKGPFTSGYALSGPTKMKWGPDGNLYVTQWGASAETVAVFGPDGAFLREATPFLADPMQQAWDEDGTLLVVYWASKDVRRYDADAKQLEVFVSDTRLQGPVNLRWDARHVSGSRDVPFESPVELACVPASAVVVVECSVSPSTVTPGADGAGATVTVAAPARSLATGSVWMLAAVFLLLVGLRGPRRRNVAVAVLAFALTASCGGDGTGPEMDDQTGRSAPRCA